MDLAMVETRTEVVRGVTHFCFNVANRKQPPCQALGLSAKTQHSCDQERALPSGCLRARWQEADRWRGEGFRAAQTGRPGIIKHHHKAGVSPGLSSLRRGWQCPG